MSDKAEGLLNRWEIRRQRVAEEAKQEELLQQAQEKPDDFNILTAEPIEDVSVIDADEVAEPEVLPDPNSIEVGGSFARFMAKSVDPTTKAAALRALWKQPQYGHIDGLLEYALDYTNQPLLSADVSAELASKVFRYVIEKEKPEPEIDADLAPTDIADPVEFASNELVPTELAEQTEETDSIAEEDSIDLADNDATTIAALSQAEQPLYQDDDLLKQAVASDEAKA
ncbi:DUF3306 domain-containing protein [Shewanella sp. Arc9-LZ]|jgi:hypothetical protein|uniref:DUF3306 domain-containing protein n=1 Tax=Shewanella sp. Arc9-LZ TaxID=2698686 RepID=UPI00137C3817|nr:DUF3306 domain-containing protein [Shewanella sp. Arc9-LZ]QHS11663.1 DUF3306 domain-containing protein [Shewanella sp. Arc9-LZ]